MATRSSRRDDVHAGPAHGKAAQGARCEPPAADVGDPIEALQRLEDEMAGVVRGTVAQALRTGEVVARDWGAVLGQALATSQVIGRAGAGLAGNVGAVARGAMAGVQDAEGDLAEAAREIVRIAIEEAELARDDVSLVARRAIDGISRGAVEAGVDPTESTAAAVRSALRTAAGMSVIAAETVKEMINDAFGMPPASPAAQD